MKRQTLATLAATLAASASFAADVPFTTADSIATLQHVIEGCSEGDRVLLGDGLYEPDYTIYLTNGVTLVGTGAANCAIRPTGSHRAVYMDGASSGLANLTVTGGKMTSGWQHGAGILMLNGTVSRCVVSNNAATVNNSFGGGIMACGGTITHSVIVKNSTLNDGGGLYLGDYGHKTLVNPVLIDRCLVAENTANGKGGGIFTYAGAGGNPIVIRHTTVANNTAGNIGGIFVNSIGTIGTVESCIFADNVQTVAGTQTGQPNWQIGNNATSTKFTNCLFGNDSATTGVDPVSGDAVFKSLARGDYHLSATSDAIDAGLVSGNVTADLDGNAVTDGAPDIGCYEFDLAAEPFSCILDYSASSIFEGASVSLSATAVNPPAGVTLRYEWTVSDGGDNVLSATGAQTGVTLANPGVYTVTLRLYDAATGDLLLETVGETTLPIYAQTLYARPGDDLTAICAGLVDGQRLILSDGTFPITAKTSINAGVEVVGAGRDATILQLAAQNVTLDVSHIFSSLSGVTIRGGNSTGGRHVVTVQRGALRDSRITQCGVYGATYGYSPLFIESGGLVERCIIDNNTNSTTKGMNTWTYVRAGAVQVKNGTLRNCLVHHNYAAATEGTVFIGANNGGDGLVENCTIVDNLNEGATLEAVAVLIGNGGILRNTLIARNSSPNWTSTTTDTVANQTPAASAPSWAVRSAAWTQRAFNNCFGESPLTYGDACAAGSTILFREPEADDWRLRVGSSCRDAGLLQPWMTSAAIDLEGLPRLFGGGVDIGCYENQALLHTLLMVK